MKIDTDLENAADFLTALKAAFTVAKDARKQRSCDGKVKYNKESASKAAIKMEAKTGEPFDVYECEFCREFHIGHSRG